MGLLHQTGVSTITTSRVIAMTKVCTNCKEELPRTTEYFCINTLKDGTKSYYSRCRVCANMGKMLHENRNKGKRDSYQREYRSKANGYYAYINQIYTVYKIREGDLRLIEDRQVGCCAICGDSLIFPDKPTKSTFHIDHCHTTGRVRGVLCVHCNRLLGVAKESIDILQKAIKYLQHLSPLLKED